MKIEKRKKKYCDNGLGKKKEPAYYYSVKKFSEIQEVEGRRMGRNWQGRGRDMG